MSTPPIAGPVYRPFRVRVTRFFSYVVVRSVLHVRVAGRDNLAQGPAIYVFNHLNWSDPLVLLAVLPGAPRWRCSGRRRRTWREAPGTG